MHGLVAYWRSTYKMDSRSPRSSMYAITVVSVTDTSLSGTLKCLASQGTFGGFGGTPQTVSTYVSLKSRLRTIL